MLLNLVKLGKNSRNYPGHNQAEVERFLPSMNKESHLLHVWRFTDGKPGHQNQSLGLVQSLQNRTQCTIHEWEIPSKFIERWRWRKRWYTEAQKVPTPHLVIGAGHRTHLMVLLAQKRYGGKSIVLMRPSIPLSFFDLCVVPEHDQVKLRSNVLQVRGVLNTICHSNEQDSSQGLMLIGGPCRHVNWSNQDVIQQISAIVESSPEVDWTLTTSRRTPDTFLDLLAEKCAEVNLRVVPASETQPGWVAERLAHAKQVWATSDSVSMLYESITSGASTGVLEVPWTSTGKLRAGLEDLIQTKMVTSFSNRASNGFLPPPPVPLAEASRVADWILDNWYPEQKMP